MRLICWSYAIFLIANVLDLWSSAILTSPAIEEQNPFMRDAAHEFLLGHAIFVKALIFLVLLGCSFWLHYILKHYDARGAAVAGALVPVYATYSLLMVSVENLLLWLNWRVL